MLKQNKFGKYAFICYEDPNNPENGFKSAASAQFAMDGLPLSDLDTNDDINRLFVQFHKNKAEYQQQCLK